MHGIGVIGYGEGGMLALYAAAWIRRIDVDMRAAASSGRARACGKSRWTAMCSGCWKQFGAAELAAMICPADLVVEDSVVPAVDLPGEGGAPAELPSRIDRRWPAEGRPDARTGVRDRRQAGLPCVQVTTSVNSDQTSLAAVTLGEFLAAESRVRNRSRDRRFREPPVAAVSNGGKPQWIVPANSTLAARQRRQVHELDRHNQLLLRESPFVRKTFMEKLDTSSLEAYEKSVEPISRRFSATR